MNNSKIFEIFDQITKIPRESGKEEKITAFLINFALERNLEYRSDSANNLVIIKPATKGMESAPVVVLQSHSDMVCEKNSDSSFNFETDPINYIKENGWLIAKETTLGADCGIGMAAQLAILDSNEIQHGPIECLFTTEEETGLKGAKELKPGFVTGKMLINLDSEDEGELFIGCAGGIDTTARYPYKEVAVPGGRMFFKALFFGATGGHSGDDIHKNRGNANQFLFRYLYNLLNKTEFDICQIDGGNKRNALAREAYAIIAIDKGDFELAKSLFNKLVSEIKDEFSISDPNIEGTIEICEEYANAVEKQVAEKLILSLNGIPHGILAMSQEIEGFVETSTNLAAVKMDEPQIIRVTTSQRSSVNSARYNAANRIESIFKLAGANVTHESEYPGWKPKLDSHLLDVSRESYTKLFGNQPIVRAIHAGLECGLFLDIYPYLDMISFGPTIKGAHAPGEKLEIASVDKFMQLLLEVLKNLK